MAVDRHETSQWWLVVETIPSDRDSSDEMIGVSVRTCVRVFVLLRVPCAWLCGLLSLCGRRTCTWFFILFYYHSKRISVDSFDFHRGIARRREVSFDRYTFFFFLLFTQRCDITDRNPFGRPKIHLRLPARRRERRQRPLSRARAGYSFLDVVNTALYHRNTVQNVPRRIQNITPTVSRYDNDYHFYPRSGKWRSAIPCIFKDFQTIFIFIRSRAVILGTVSTFSRDRRNFDRICIFFF